MKNNNIVKQMVLTGIMTAIGILVGLLQFPFLGGNLYLIGIVVFLFPLILRIDFAIIATSISVPIADVISGFGHYAWISFIAYNVAIIIIWFFRSFKFLFILGAGLAALSVIAIYYLLERVTFGHAFAIKDLITTSIEMSIVYVSVVILYRPVKHVVVLVG